MELDEAAFSAGIEAARADIAGEKFIYHWTGHAGHTGHWIVCELVRRFGVNVSDGFGVCFVTTSSKSFNQGYNATLGKEIDRRYGIGAFDAVFVESREQSEEALSQAKRAWLQRQP